MSREGSAVGDESFADASCMTRAMECGAWQRIRGVLEVLIK